MARTAAQADADGLTLAELQSIGAEAGIGPEYIAAAAAEFKGDAPADDTPWWYPGPATVEAETVVPGTVTDGPVWAAMVRELRDTFDTDGVAAQLGNTLEWSFEPPTGGESTRVEVTPEPHGTRIRITRSKTSAARLGPMAAGTLGVSGLLLGGLIFAIKGFDVAGLVLMVMLIAVGLSLAALNIPLYRATVRRDQHTLDHLVDRLELIALKGMPARQTASSESATSAEPATTEHQWDAPEVGAEAPREETRLVSDQQRTTS